MKLEKEELELSGRHCPIPPLFPCYQYQVGIHFATNHNNNNYNLITIIILFYEIFILLNIVLITIT